MVLGSLFGSVSRLGRGIFSRLGFSSRGSASDSSRGDDSLLYGLGSSSIRLSDVKSILSKIERYKGELHSKSRRKYNRTLNIKFSERDLMLVLDEVVLPSSFRVRGIRFNRSYEPSPLFAYFGIYKPISINKLNDILLEYVTICG